MFFNFEFFHYQLMALKNISKGLFFIVPPVYFYYNLNMKTINTRSFGDVNNYLNQTKKTNNLMIFLKGLWFFLFGLYLWFFFRPNKTQETLNLLIIELLKNNVLSETFKETYNQLNPAQMRIS